MSLIAEPYLTQLQQWPEKGRHILAQFDAETIIVYQAYRPKTGSWAVEHGVFGHGFSYQRMSWIKPNFLWMMYRSGWGTKEGQEMTLALRLSRSFFDSLLAQAVPAQYCPNTFDSEATWKQAVADSDVRLQWDPDHDPAGNPVERRAIQLGLRGSVLREYGRQALLEVVDLTEFVAEQRNLLQLNGVSKLLTPRERFYRPVDLAAGNRLGLDDTENDCVE